MLFRNMSRCVGLEFAFLRSMNNPDALPAILQGTRPAPVDDSRSRSLWGGCVLVAAALLLSAAQVRGASFTQENLGNFPDAVEIVGEFGQFSNLNINGDVVSGPGFLFTVTNTSYSTPGTGASNAGDASAFENDPDGDFAVSDVLTPAAAAAISAQQPFGLYSFGAGLPTQFNGVDLGQTFSAPDGFFFDVEPHGVVSGVSFSEFNFKHINPDGSVNPDGLVFDPNAAGAIDESVFSNPDFDGAQFFISTPEGFDPLLHITGTVNDPTDGPGRIDVATELAWLENGEVATVFENASFNGDAPDDIELRPRGQLEFQVDIGEPNAHLAEPPMLALLSLGLILVGARRARRA
jgi:hypothetical protein